jgi:hypothetical protein
VTDEHVIARLDTVIAILRLAFRDAFDKARQEMLADPVAAALLGAATEWVDAGTLQERASTTTKQSKRTVQRRIAGLLSEGFLEQTGSGPSIRYRNTKLI